MAVPPAQTDAAVRALNTCNSALGDGKCAFAAADVEARWYAQMRFDPERKELISIELFDRSPEGERVASSQLEFKERDAAPERWASVGVVVAALVAAQKLKRQWIGIDMSPTACRVMAKRLKKDCGLKEDEKLWEIGRGFVVRDLPKTEEELRKYPPFEFENWAVVALGGIPKQSASRRSRN